MRWALLLPSLGFLLRRLTPCWEQLESLWWNWKGQPQEGHQCTGLGMAGAPWSQEQSNLRALTC